MSQIIEGDCLEVMAGMEAESFDAIVTDPPYGLEFMGKEWDRLWNEPDDSFTERPKGGTGPYDRKRASYGTDSRVMQVWHERWATEALRVAKPGAHLLAFGGTRTYHRLTCALEDAGWEIRDCLVWAYASGFPKSLDVSKAIDKARDDHDDRCRVALWLRPYVKRVGFGIVSAAFHFKDETMVRARWTTCSQPQTPTWEQWQKLKKLCYLPDEMDAEVWRLNGRKGKPGEAWDQREVIGTRSAIPGVAFSSVGPNELDVTAPATDAAKRWQGWGTALKPAWEPIVLARKPLRGTVASNVQRYGTGALNIDASRIGTGADKGIWPITDREVRTTFDQIVRPGETNTSAGRWPPNLLLTDAELFDVRNDGVVGSGAVAYSSGFYEAVVRGERDGPASIPLDNGPQYGDTGGYSRFFLIPKASRSDREPVWGEELAEGMVGGRSRADGRQWDIPGSTLDNGKPRRRNTHPTTKPVDLMRHLVRLVTPPGGRILDPFLGSGTTAIAAIMEGFECVGIEREPEYVAIAEARLNGVQQGIGL